MAYKRRKIKIVKARKQQFNLILNKELWVRGSKEIKEYRDENSGSNCLCCGLPFGEGMNQKCLDHSHQSGLVRGVLCAKCNIMLGRIEIYYRKLLGKTKVPLLTILKNLVQYLKDAEQVEPKMLHGEIIEAEKKRVSRWKNETIHAKLLLKGLDILPIDSYTKHDLVTLHLQQFIKEKEDEV